jgi:hypothetical protein
VHPSPHISLNGLAVTTHWSCPQAPGCTDQRGDNFPETGGEQMVDITPLHERLRQEFLAFRRRGWRL